MEKLVNNIFYQFSYKMEDGFNLDNFNEKIINVKNVRLNKKDEANELTLGISYIGCIGDTETPVIVGEEGNNVFWGRFVKGNYGDKIYLYQNDGDYSGINESTEYIGRESDKEPNEIVVKDFYYIFKLFYNNDTNSIEGIISKPTFKEFISKNDLFFLLESILKNSFGNGNESVNIQDFELMEIYSQEELSRLPSMGASISYIETQRIQDVMGKLEVDVDGYDENDKVDINVSINKTNTASVFNIFKTKISERTGTGNIPIKKIKIKTESGTFLDLKGFYFTKKINVVLDDGTIIGENKAYFISELAKFIQNKIYPIIR